MPTDRRGWRVRSPCCRRPCVPALSRQFTPELYTVGERLEPARLDRLSGDGRQSDLSGALAAIRERYRGQPIAGIVLLSDGGDTGQAARRRATGRRARRCLRSASDRPTGSATTRSPAVTAGDQRLDQASVDLHVSAVELGVRPRAVSAARAGERPGAREPPRRAAGGWRADRGGVHRLAGSGEPDRLHRGDSRRRVRSRRREQRAQRARQSGRPQAATAHRSKARRDSSTVS